MLRRIFAPAVFFGLLAHLGADQPEAPAKSPREALTVFGDVIGVWNCTVTPVGMKDKFWTEKMDWGWKFKDKDAWIVINFDKSKNFLEGELRYVPEKDHFTLTLTDLNKEKVTYVGTVEKRDETKVFTLERDAGKENQKIVFTFLHSNRFLYRYEVRPEGRPLFAKKWSAGATKDGESFAAGSGKPECVVSGGTGTIAVTFQGKTYYVCCSGCRDEFNSNAAKYIREYEEKQAKLKKK